jgi:8-oxo-dGTP pyrophosphatase MutT (NUDIX family)
VPVRPGPLGAVRCRRLLPVAVADGCPLVLLCLRSGFTDAAFTWGTAGGAIEPGEDAWAAAVREAAEEITLPAYERAGQHADAARAACGSTSRSW